MPGFGIASPLFRGGETDFTAFLVRLIVAGFGLAYFSGQMRKGKVTIKIPAANWLLTGLLVIFSLSLFFSHYYFASIYWYSNLLVYFLFFILRWGLPGPRTGKNY